MDNPTAWRGCQSLHVLVIAGSGTHDLCQWNTHCVSMWVCAQEDRSPVACHSPCVATPELAWARISCPHGVYWPSAHTHTQELNMENTIPLLCSWKTFAYTHTNKNMRTHTRMHTHIKNMQFAQEHSINIFTIHVNGFKRKHAPCACTQWTFVNLSTSQSLLRLTTCTCIYCTAFKCTALCIPCMVVT